MPRADRVLYASLLRIGERFRAEGLPLLGVAGGGGTAAAAACWDLSWPSTVRRLVEEPPPGVGLSGKR